MTTPFAPAVQLSLCESALRVADWGVFTVEDSAY